MMTTQQTPKCTAASHEAIRGSAMAFSRLTPIGKMTDVVDDDGPVRRDVYALANCSCGSTLARLVSSAVLS